MKLKSSVVEWNNHISLEMIQAFAIWQALFKKPAQKAHTDTDAKYEKSAVEVFHDEGSLTDVCRTPSLQQTFIDTRL